MLHGGAPHKISFLSGTKVCEKLAEILENKTILKDIRNISPHIQTSFLEAFHSLVIRYAPKHTGFSFLAMYTRYAIFQKFLVFEVLNAPVCLYNLHTARMIECAILVYVSGSFWQDFITMKIAKTASWHNGRIELTRIYFTTKGLSDSLSSDSLVSPVTLQAAIDFVCMDPYLITGLLSCRAQFIAIWLHTAHVQ